ncbi:MAG: class I SAM-dependent methyltransferase [Sulfuricella sp.]|nr:class I SAM-dependent methyltransferase [Sulfuricella sp.]
MGTPPADGDYLTDLEYTGHFYPFLAPARLAYAAAINGHRAPSLERFTWCELGCGKGITALLLAALHPGGEFIACDLNPHHIEYGESLRRAAGVENLRFHAKSIGQMLDDDLPPCDFIVMHGLYSWVPAPVRDEIHAFLRRFLKPGGLVLASYNALPGWAPLQPLRQMMRTLAAAQSGDSAQKVRGAFDRLKRLAEGGAGYFRDVPAAAAHLDEMAQRDVRYLAHEYLTPCNTPFHFAEVAQAMAGAGLAYAGSATPRHNYLELMAPPEFDGLLAAAGSRVELETLRDFLVNTRFRRDIYIAAPAADGAAPDLSGLAFCLTGVPGRLPLKAGDESPVLFDIEPEAQAVAAIHALLERGPASALQIHHAAGKATAEESSVLIQKLVVAGHLDPCPPAAPAVGWPRVNAILVETALRERLPNIPLACPGMGNAVYTETLHAAAVEAALAHADPATAAEQVLARLRNLGHAVQRASASGASEAVDQGEIADYVTDLWHVLRNVPSDGAQLMRLYGFMS